MAEILVVDDDDLFAEMACRILADAGYGCDWATGGADALALMAVRRFDLLLLDRELGQGGAGGLEVLRRLRSAPHDHDLPVIMLTSAASDHDDEALLFLGAQDHLRKPFGRRRLLDKVRGVLAGTFSPYGAQSPFTEGRGFEATRRLVF